MNDQQELPLQQTPQLTSWLKGAPQRVGWFNTRDVGSADDVARERRFWNGQWWSHPVTLGADDDSRFCIAQHRRSLSATTLTTEYQGLVNPHPDTAATRRRLEVKHA